MTVVVVSWILVLLAVFGFNQARDVVTESRAVEVGIERHQARACARSGVEFARHVVGSTPLGLRAILTHPGSENPLVGTHECGEGRFAVGTSHRDPWSETWSCGVQDEGARVPLSTVDAATLEKLPDLSDAAVEAILEAVRVAGPHPCAPLGALGLDETSLACATGHLSRFGASVNVNTAPRGVLAAVGVPDRALDRFLTWRAGPDRIDRTRDDRWLRSVDELFEPGHECDLNADESAAIAYLESTGRLTAQSEHFRLRARGWVPGGHAICEIEVVLEATEDALPRIVELTEHWRK